MKEHLIHPSIQKEWPRVSCRMHTWHRLYLAGQYRPIQQLLIQDHAMKVTVIDYDPCRFPSLPYSFASSRPWPLANFTSTLSNTKRCPSSLVRWYSPHDRQGDLFSSSLQALPVDFFLLRSWPSSYFNAQPHSVRGSRKRTAWSSTGILRNLSPGSAFILFPVANTLSVLFTCRIPSGNTIYCHNMGR